MDFETSAHIIGNCPITQDARIKHHNSICEVLSIEAKMENWTVFQEPHLTDEENELHKPDLIFVKEDKVFVVDMKVRYEHSNSLLKLAAAEEGKKYQCLLKQIQELTNVIVIKFMGFCLRAQGECDERNSALLLALGLSKTRLEKTAQALASRAFLFSVDIIRIFTSKACSIVPI